MLELQDAHVMPGDGDGHGSECVDEQHRTNEELTFYPKLRGVHLLQSS